MNNIFNNDNIIKNDIRKIKWRINKEIWELAISPIENPKSECFECSASMCSYDLCPGDQYKWQINF